MKDGIDTIIRKLLGCIAGLAALAFGFYLMQGSHGNGGVVFILAGTVTLMLVISKKADP